MPLAGSSHSTRHALPRVQLLCSRNRAYRTLSACTLLRCCSHPPTPGCRYGPVQGTSSPSGMAPAAGAAPGSPYATAWYPSTLVVASPAAGYSTISEASESSGQHQHHQQQSVLHGSPRSARYTTPEPPARRSEALQRSMQQPFPLLQPSTSQHFSSPRDQQLMAHHDDDTTLYDDDGIQPEPCLSTGSSTGTASPASVHSSQAGSPGHHMPAHHEPAPDRQRPAAGWHRHTSSSGPALAGASQLLRPSQVLGAGLGASELDFLDGHLAGRDEEGGAAAGQQRGAGGAGGAGAQAVRLWQSLPSAPACNSATSLAATQAGVSGPACAAGAGSARQPSWEDGCSIGLGGYTGDGYEDSDDVLLGASARPAAVAAAIQGAAVAAGCANTCNGRMSSAEQGSSSGSSSSQADVVGGSSRGSTVAPPLQCHAPQEQDLQHLVQQQLLDGKAFVEEDYEDDWVEDEGDE